jgi:hypothetical protein
MICQETNQLADVLKISLRKKDNKEKMIPLKSVTHKQKSILPTRVKMTRKIKSLEGIPLNIYLLDIFTLVIILDIRKYTAKLMDNTIVKMSKDIRTISTIQRRETITHFIPCKTSIVNAKNETTVVIKLMNVDFQSMIKG